MTLTCPSKPRKNVLRDVFCGLVAGIGLGCSVPTYIGAINQDGSAQDSSAPADRFPNQDRGGERWSSFEGRDAFFPPGHEVWLLDNGRPCASGRSQSCDGAGEFCDIYGNGCTGGEGVCLHVLPENCPTPTAFSAVCGCDNITYGNNCLRLAARVAAQYQGACR